MKAKTLFQLRGWDVQGLCLRSAGSAVARARVAKAVATSVLCAGAVFAAEAAFAGSDARHRQSSSYDVYVGIVPAAQTMRDAQLDRLHKLSGQHAEHFGKATQHVTIAVFRKSDGQRVTNAAVSAEFVESDLIHVQRTSKPLNARDLSGGVTYCNFFDLRWNGGYQMDVTIREEGRGAEKVTFVQKSY